MKYRVELGFIQHSRASVIIDATSLEAAKALAEDIDAEEVEDWDYFDGEITVYDVSEADPQEVATASICEDVAEENANPALSAGVHEACGAGFAEHPRANKEEEREAMKLVTDELRAVLAGLSETEDECDPLARAKFFASWCGWSWYPVEYNGDDIFVGVVMRPDRKTEFTLFQLSELEALRGPGGLRVERDPLFKPTRVSSLGMRLERIEDSEWWRDEP